MSLMSGFSCRLFARLMVGGAMLIAATAANASQFTLGRTILLDGGRAAVVPVPLCRNIDAIKIKAERDVRINRVVLTFQNGSKKNINFNRDLKKNQETEWRKLGMERCVDSIKVYGNSERSTGGIKVFGRN